MLIALLLGGKWVHRMKYAMYLRFLLLTGVLSRFWDSQSLQNLVAISQKLIMHKEIMAKYSGYSIQGLIAQVKDKEYCISSKWLIC